VAGVCARAWWQFFSEKKKNRGSEGASWHVGDGIAIEKNKRVWCSAGTTHG
jgi:hypothetical protein